MFIWVWTKLICIEWIINSLINYTKFNNNIKHKINLAFKKIIINISNSYLNKEIFMNNKDFIKKIIGKNVHYYWNKNNLKFKDV